MFYNNVSLSPKNTKYHTFSPSGTTKAVTNFVAAFSFSPLTSKFFSTNSHSHSTIFQGISITLPMHKPF